MDTLNPYEPPQALAEEVRATTRSHQRKFRMTLAGLMVPCSLVAAGITFTMTEQILSTRFAGVSYQIRDWVSFWGALVVSVVTVLVVEYSFLKAIRGVRTQA